MAEEDSGTLEEGERRGGKTQWSLGTCSKMPEKDPGATSNGSEIPDECLKVLRRGFVTSELPPTTVAGG